jgi:hypothetical protein
MMGEAADHNKAIRANKNLLTSAIMAEAERRGFTERQTETAWRRTNRKIDILHLQFLGSAICKKWRVPFGSFSLEPGCFFSSIPSLNGEHIILDQSIVVRPWYGLRQIGLRVFRRLYQEECPRHNLWWVGSGPDHVENVIYDVIERINSVVLPFYSRFEDDEEPLRTLLEEDGVPLSKKEGLFDFGNKDSPRRLFYIGFAALEREHWPLAIECFLKCHERANASILKKNLEFMSAVEKGLDRARQGAAGI